MTTETNKAIVRRYQEAYNTNQLHQLDEVVVENIQTPNMLPGFAPGLAGLKQLHQFTLEAWPNFQAEIVDLVAEGDYVVARITCAATPQKEAFGVPANGKSFKISGQYIVRIENGKIVEYLGVEDALGLMQQMGLMPAPGGL